MLFMTISYIQHFFQQMLEWNKNYCICEKCSIFNLEELLINFESGKHVSIWAA